MSSNSDEFDVELTLKKLFSLAGKALVKLTYPVRIIFHKPVKLLAGLCVAAVVSYGLYKVLPPVYKATFSFKPTSAGDTFFLNGLKDLHELIADNDADQVAAELSIPVAVADAINYMEAKAVWAGPRRDTILVVVVQVKSKNKADFGVIQDAVMSYLEESEHYARLKKMRQQEITSLHKKLAADMQEIDSLKKLMAQSMLPRNAGGFVYGEPLDPVKLYDAGLNLYRQQLSLNWGQEYINSFELTSPCVVSNKPAWPRLSYLIAGCSLVVALVVGWHNHTMRIRK